MGEITWLSRSQHRLGFAADWSHVRCLHESTTSSTPQSPPFLFSRLETRDPLCVRPPSASGYIILGFLVDVREKGVEVEGEAIINHDKIEVYQLLTTRQ